MPTDVQIDAVWTEHRPYLVDLAFRMLGDVGDAEDVVQEAFHRLAQGGLDAIDDERGWLIVVTSRLCLDQIRSARARRVRVTDADDLEARDGAPVAASRPIDPSDRVTLDDSVHLALLVVLERLTPAERVAFVLHDVFQVPFDAIADAVGRPAATCRQLALRARRKLEDVDGGRRLDVSRTEHREVTERFIAACAGGSFEELLHVLAPDVWGGVDTLPDFVARGAQRVARGILAFWGGRGTLVSMPVGGQPAVLAFLDRSLAVVIGLTIRDGLVREIHVIADERKLAHVRAQLAGAAIQ